MLRAEGVTKEYEQKHHRVTGLDDVSLEIPSGDFVAIVGPSGCGKSTLLLTLGGMLSPTSGKVFLEEKSLYDHTADERAKLRKQSIGFVFQQFNLVPYLTARENVAVPLFLSGLDAATQEARATELLERVGLAEREHHKPAELSVGQQQRVALARTLANDPRLILADEPTGNLDPDMAEEVFSFLEELNAEGRTVVLVTHDPKSAERCKRTLKLRDGKLEASVDQDDSARKRRPA